jgi:peptidase M28-like protein
MLRETAFLACFLAGAAAALAAEPPLRAPSADEVRAIDLDLVACGTRHSLSSWSDPKRGIGCARDKIRGIFERIASGHPGARVVVDSFEATSPRTHDRPAPLQNVYLVVPGTDPARAKTAFVVSGHFDSMCSDIMNSDLDAPGADDDASGTTVSLASAKLLAGRSHRATLVFAAVSGEEQGLLGGKRLFEWLGQQGYAVGAMLNNDIVGASNGSEDRRPRLFSDAADFTPSRELGLWIDEFLGRDAVRLVFRKDRFGRGGDHLPFLEAGMPAVRFCEPKEDYRHQHQTPRVENGVEYGDLPKFMDFDVLAKVAELNAAALDGLANAPAPPADVAVRGAVKPNAALTFTGEPDAEREAYEVLFRETTEARWKVLQGVKQAGTVELSGRPIDNELFAVRSVGRNGVRSIAVDAKPLAK